MNVQVQNALRVCDVVSCGSEVLRASDRQFNKMLQTCNLQWGSENRPFENRKHSKTGHFGGRFLNGSDFKWSGLWSQPFEIRPFENRTIWLA